MILWQKFDVTLEIHRVRDLCKVRGKKKDGVGCQEYIQNCLYNKSAALNHPTYMLLQDKYSLIMCYEAMTTKLVLNLIRWPALRIHTVVPMTEEQAEISYTPEFLLTTQVGHFV